MAVTQLADAIIPSVFDPYVRQQTEAKTRLLRSGAMVRDSSMDGMLDGPGLLFQVPSWKDLANDPANVSTDEAPGVNDSVPYKIGSAQETAVRLSRNNSWSGADLVAALAGEDPMMVIGDNVSRYWARMLQAAFIATWTGVFADNAAAPTGTEHVQGDLTNDIKGGGYVAGTTDFSAEALLDAAVTMGDSAEDLTVILVHSIVYNRMQKNNLIDFIPDSRGETQIATFLGRRVVVDDTMPKASGVYDSWLFGFGSTRLGMGNPKRPSETRRYPEAGHGGGVEVLFSRVEWLLHPVGHQYVGTAPNGGPSDAATSNNLAHAGSWKRVWSERKQIKAARLVTREHA